MLSRPGLSMSATPGPAAENREHTGDHQVDRGRYTPVQSQYAPPPEGGAAASDNIQYTGQVVRLV